MAPATVRGSLPLNRPGRTGAAGVRFDVRAFAKRPDRLEVAASHPQRLRRCGGPAVCWTGCLLLPCCRATPGGGSAGCQVRGGGVRAVDRCGAASRHLRRLRGSDISTLREEITDAPRMFFHLIILGHEIAHLVHRHLYAGQQETADYRALEY